MTYKITHKNSTVSGTPPASGDIDVGEIAINAADAELYVKDTNGNIRKFQNTTTGTAAGVRFTQTGTGAVQRTVESKLQDVVSVKDFGAVGDGVADDTAAIQAAIDYVSANPIGGILAFPDGTYSLGGLLIASNITLDGGGCTLKAKAGTNCQMRLTGNSNIKICNFIFDCANLTLAGLPAQDTGAGACAIYNRTGLDPTNVTVDGNQFINIPMPVPITQKYHAIVFNGANCIVTNNYSDQSDGDTLNFNGGFAFVNNNHVRNSTDGGIAFNNGARGIISSNYLYRCNLGVGAGPEGDQSDPQKYHSLQVTSNTFDSCDWGINFGWFAYAGRTAPTNFVIDGNVLHNCKSYGFRYDGHAAGFKANGVISNNVFYRTGSNSYDGTNGTDSSDVYLVNCGDICCNNNTLSDPVASSFRRSFVIEASNRTVISSNVIEGGAVGYTTGVRYLGSSTNDAICASNAIRNVGIGVSLEGSGNGNFVTIKQNAISDFSTKGITVNNSCTNVNVTSNKLKSSANVIGIDLSPAVDICVCNFNSVETANTTAIIMNGPVSSNNYDISYNTVFGKLVTDGGPAGSTKRVTGNW
jgi:hypothetical protein